VPSGKVVGEAEVDRQPAALFFGQPLAPLAHQRGLAVVDMAAGAGSCRIS
jgi:hypothetical protein